MHWQKHNERRWEAQPDPRKDRRRSLKDEDEKAGEEGDEEEEVEEEEKQGETSEACWRRGEMRVLLFGVLARHSLFDLLACVHDVVSLSASVNLY